MGQQRRSELTSERRAARDEVERKLEEARQISENPMGSPRKGDESFRTEISSVIKLVTVPSRDP